MGIVLYIVSMWVAGIMEGLMWRAYDKFGFLQYSFVESVVAVHPFFVIRMLGGVLFLTGGLIMVYNLIRTVTSPTTELTALRHRRFGHTSPTWRGGSLTTMFIRHEWFEKNAIFLLLGTLVTVAIGGIVEIVPLFTIETTVEHVEGVRPYSPLELRAATSTCGKAAICVTASKSARCAMKWNVTATTPSQRRACMITLSSGDPSASAQTWRA